MSLDEFLYTLHFDTDKAKPIDFEVDWGDAPFPYKLYRGLPVFPLTAEVPLSLEGWATTTEPGHKEPGHKELGHFLWYVYGLTQFCQTAIFADTADQSVGVMQSPRRFVPSGGALYPNELYVYLKTKDLPSGIFHYDVAHHRLVLLREGNFDCYLSHALGERYDLSACFAAAFVTTYFWKNFYKYNNFAYRLQGLDAGVMIGQLLEVAKRFGIEPVVSFHFLDEAVNHLLGLNEKEESVYAVIPLSMDVQNTWFTQNNHVDCTITASELCQELKPLQYEQYVRSKRIMEYPMLIKMNEASKQESWRSFHTHQEQTNVKDSVRQEVALPSVRSLSYDLPSVIRKRYSPESDFVLRNVSSHQLAHLLRESTNAFSYRNDLDGMSALRNMKEPYVPRVSLFCCLYNVDGLADGAYHYEQTDHSLQMIRPNDQRNSLQQALSLDNVNLFQVPICLHVVGQRDHLKSSLGYRGYRIQQMEAGMLVQRLLIIASALGIGGHPLLGFDVASIDEVYQLAPQGKTSLIQIPVGPYRNRARLQGGLHG